MLIESATKDDIPKLTDLTLEVSAVTQFLYSDLPAPLSKETALAADMALPHSKCSYSHSLVIRRDQALDGMVTFYPSTAFAAPSSDSRFPSWKIEHLKNLYTTPVPHSMYIAALIVHASTRGKGYGKMLIDQVAEHAKAAGLSAISLHVWCDNHSGIAFYRQLGFETVAHIAIDNHPHIQHEGGCYLEQKRL